MKSLAPLPTSVVHALRPDPVLIRAMQTALALLQEAYVTARRLDRDPWEFALELAALREVGLSRNVIRALVCQGLLDHRVERTPYGAKHRAFRAPRSLRLQPSSCFTLSATGQSLASEASSAANPLPAPRQGAHGAAVPFWDVDRRELRLGSVIVKRFRQPAKNQETILAAFQEDGWPPRIDNPLPGSADTDAVNRLHDAVKMLNRHTRDLLRFLSDGCGLGVTWELTGRNVLWAS